MSHVSLHSDAMANFGMITQTAAKPEVRRAVLPSLSGQEGRAVCCAVLFAGRLLVLLWKYYVRRGCKRNIEEYLRYARSKGVFYAPLFHYILHSDD
jgi:hypothetical protein